MVLGVVWLAAAAQAERIVKVGDEVRLELPAGWEVLEKADKASGHPLPELRFSARSGAGRQVAWMTVSSAPRESAEQALPGQVEKTPLDELETNAMLRTLTGEGYRVLTVDNSWLSRADGPVVTSLIRCSPREAEQRAVETAAWFQKGHVVRVQLRYDLSLADSGEIQALKKALRFGDSPRQILNTGYPAADPAISSMATLHPTPVASPTGLKGAGATIPASGTPLAPVVAENDPRGAELLARYRDSLAIVKGRDAAGSSFVCKLNGHTFLVTNVHVIRGNESARFTLVDQSPITVGKAAAAVGHDIMAFAVPDDLHAIEIMEEVDREAKIGDRVVVLGNAEGESVVNLKEGKIVGIGPNLVEVDAPFVPGNSGSPIVHLDSGKAIGVATYTVTREVGDGKGKVEEKVRRFGYRLDSVKKWQPVSWSAFFAQDRALRGVEELSSALIGLLDDIGDDGKLTAGRHQNAAIRRPVAEFVESAYHHGASDDDFGKAARNMLSFVRIACRTDIRKVRPTLAYDYLARELDEEERLRERIYETFSRILNAQ